MKISVITVTLNNAATIERCIQSVNDQTWPDLEHIVVDGASEDNTVEIIRSMPNRVTHLVSEPDTGIYDAINKGIRLATGDVIGILNSDDVYADAYTIQKIVLAFQEHNPDCVYGNLIYTNTNGRMVRAWQSRPFTTGLFQKSWTPAHPTFYVKREVYARYGIYKTNYKIAADVELMFRFLEIHRVKSHFIDMILVNMRYGGVSTKGLKSSFIITKEMRRAFRENGRKLNLIKYIAYKLLKTREMLVFRVKTD